MIQVIQKDQWPLYKKCKTINVTLDSTKLKTPQKQDQPKPKHQQKI